MSGENDREALVVKATSGFYDLVFGDGERVQAKLRGRLKKIDRKSDLCVIGDRVRFVSEGDSHVIEEVLPRRSKFARRHPARRREDIVVANLDLLFAVFCYGAPSFSPRLLDRFLAIAAFADVEVVVIANKVDKRTEEVDSLFEDYRKIGYQVLRTSKDNPESLDALRALLQDRIAAFVGPSGVGKSSMLNVLSPELSLPTGAISSSHNKGRHTTRVATLFESGGGYIADTPGIRELGTWELPSEELASCFIEFRPHIGNCAYRNCRHLREPNCAIKDAVDQSDISEERYSSYQRMHEDALELEVKY